MRLHSFIQEPASAQAVLDGYASIVAGESDPRELATINLLLQAGARVEALSALQTRLETMPADPYAEAVLVEIACWDPSSYSAGRLAAQEWLVQHTDLGLTGYVQARADFLGERAQHADEVSGAAGIAQLSPFLALLLAVGVVWGSLRVLVRNLAPSSVGF
jgi:hypothetical protein